MTKPIEIYRWNDSLAEHKKLSNHGGDEDWVVIVPKSLTCHYIPAFDDYLQGYEQSDHVVDYVDGWGHVDRHEDEDCYILIFAHC